MTNLSLSTAVSGVRTGLRLSMKQKMLTLLLLPVFTLAGCSDDSDPHNHPELTSGKQLFEHHCVECHKKDATGRIFYGFPNLVEFKLDISQIRTHVLGKEVPGRKMPSFSTLPDEEVQKIAEHLVSLR